MRRPRARSGDRSGTARLRAKLGCGDKRQSREGRRRCLVNHQPFSRPPRGAPLTLALRHLASTPCPLKVLIMIYNNNNNKGYLSHSITAIGLALSRAVLCNPTQTIYTYLLFVHLYRMHIFHSCSRAPYPASPQNGGRPHTFVTKPPHTLIQTGGPHVVRSLTATAVDRKAAAFMK
jgi:hypothetical protein